MSLLTDAPSLPPVLIDEQAPGLPPTSPPVESDDTPATNETRPSRRNERLALAALLLGSGVLYMWGLSASGWANSFYSAAAQAGSQSWKAFFFGASDAAGSITVDKPPLALWPMALSVRIFGLSSWSLLVPQALMGVATVGVVYATVRRYASAGAALLAGAVMATTPVATLMFRFNNPDALLTLLMAVAAYTGLRAIDDERFRWLVATGGLVGLGFLTKQLQVLLIVPGLALAYAVAGPARILHRIRGLVIAGGSLVAAAGWWIAVVELVPASWRPYIGGSQNNSILELTLGYNGLGRLTGNETGSVTGGGGGAGPGGAGAGGPGGGSMWGPTGVTRLFGSVGGGQIAWLIPAAMILGIAGLWVTRRRPRTDATRAALLVFGAWLVLTGLVFSSMAGIYHDYYTVALAPAIAALVGLGAHLLWQRRSHRLGLPLLAAVTAVTTIWSARLLGRADWAPWVADLVLVAGLSAAAGLVASRWLGRRVLAVAAAAAVLACLGGPVAWSLQTAATPHTGSIVTAGPPVADAGRGGGLPGGPGGRLGATTPGGAGVTGPNGGATGPPGGAVPTPGGNASPGMGPGGPPSGGGTGFGAGPPAGPSSSGGSTTAPSQGGGASQGGTSNAPQGGSGPGGGLLDAVDPSDDVVAALLEDADHYTWIAATVGANNASGYQLATERSVVPIGGFNGTDPSPTLQQFEDWVSAGRVHWFIAGGLDGRGANGGSAESQAIATWVTQHFDATTIDGVTLYDLSGGVS